MLLGEDLCHLQLGLRSARARTIVDQQTEVGTDDTYCRVCRIFSSTTSLLKCLINQVQWNFAAAASIIIIARLIVVRLGGQLSRWYVHYVKLLTKYGIFLNIVL